MPYRKQYRRKTRKAFTPRRAKSKRRAPRAAQQILRLVIDTSPQSQAPAFVRDAEGNIQMPSRTRTPRF